MSRNAEALLVASGSILAALGVAMVGFAEGTWLDAQVALTFLVFALSFGGVHMALRAWAPNANPLVLPIAAFLTAIGFIEVYRLDRQLATLQQWWLIVASVFAVVTLRLLLNSGVAVLRRYRYIFLAVAVVLLLLPLLPESWPLHGATINGSRLWVRLQVPVGGVVLSFQPGEMAKVFLTIFLASYLADRAEAMSTVSRRIGPFRFPEPRHLGPVVIAAAAAFLVLIYQRDLGASLLLFGLFIGMLYAATGRTFYLGAGALAVAVGGLTAYRAFGHVRIRVTAWLDPFADYAGSGYQVVQGLFAMGSGSLTGSGLGLGRPDLIPAAATDFVFAAIAEELGLAGSIAVLTGFALFVTVGFGIALRSRDRFRKYLAAGLTILIGLQALLIIAGILRLFPITGVTLPFMSYGGSSLLASAVIVALLARVSHEERT
ncbi:MAG: FtsW/RodA/SpoVE family cell cycle protein [Actinomycetota bacterium]|nr:FtsW/RodA/SpoVE family cell cycle protein [Actinomycetota bacterium]